MLKESQYDSWWHNSSMSDFLILLLLNQMLQELQNEIPGKKEIEYLIPKLNHAICTFGKSSIVMRKSYSMPWHSISFSCGLCSCLFVQKSLSLSFSTRSFPQEAGLLGEIAPLNCSLLIRYNIDDVAAAQNSVEGRTRGLVFTVSGIFSYLDKKSNARNTVFHAPRRWYPSKPLTYLQPAYRHSGTSFSFRSLQNCPFKTTKSSSNKWILLTCDRH